jgi:hypothetical protein
MHMRKWAIIMGYIRGTGNGHVWGDGAHGVARWDIQGEVSFWLWFDQDRRRREQRRPIQQRVLV